ncbi:MAG: hypothetical protein JWL90_3814 [Chthoniobacteraceae bacterium]|nr:hypothetical protein [Chthoniobacteraceae bacterium]
MNYVMIRASKNLHRVVGSVPLVIAALFSIGTAAQATQVLVNSLTLEGSVATQSSTLANYTADFAINGNPSDFTHTLASDPTPTWSLTLPSNQDFSYVRVINRESCCGERLRDITVSVFSDETATTQIFDSGLLNPDNVLGSPQKLDVPLSGSLNGRVVKVARTVISPDGTDDRSILSLGEVQLFDISNVTLPLGTDLTRANLFNLSARQSTTEGSFGPSAAINGNNSDFSHTQGADAAAFWEVNLGEDFDLQNINIHNRENCCGSRLRDITVEIRDSTGKLIFQSALLNPENAGFSFPAGPADLSLDLAGLNGGVPLRGQTVRILRTADSDLSGSGGGGNQDEANVLSMGEVSIVGGTVAVPEPASFALLGLAGLVAGSRRWRGSKK